MSTPKYLDDAIPDGCAIGRSSTDSFILTAAVTLGDGSNFILSTSTGSKIGTASTQKLGFLGASPMAQSTLANAAIATTVAVSTTSTIWGFGTSTQANSIVALANEIRALLVALGLGK
jgi:hypothetical protein